MVGEGTSGVALAKGNRRWRGGADDLLRSPIVLILSYVAIRFITVRYSRLPTPIAEPTIHSLLRYIAGESTLAQLNGEPM
jgi:hypothetical protein